ncbi:hypothetical protein LNP20_22630 [Klebsiella pneumoniae subsp. pneumoniae]|nr:hypothetical protein [Klebsiella pneumoniae subsp. pneumoniae]
MALWGGRFTQAADQRFKQFNDSLRFDYRLAEQDIVGSVAWSKALVTVGVLSAAEQQQLEEALNVLLEEVRANPQQILASDAEDIHSWVEGKLIDKVGQLGKKLHTGRSRNDQVATDLKLWCKDTVVELLSANRQLQSALVETAQQNQDAVMPGYTHLQRAQPVTFAHWCLAYVEMLARDESRLQDAAESASTSARWAAARWRGRRMKSTASSWPAGWALPPPLATASTACPIAIMCWSCFPMRLSAWCICRAFAEDLIFFNSGEAELRRAFRPRDLRLLADAAEEKPGRPGAYPWQMRPRAGCADRHDDDAERTAAGLQTKTCRKIKRGFSTPWIPGSTACIWRPWCWTAFR